MKGAKGVEVERGENEDDEWEPDAELDKRIKEKEAIKVSVTKIR